MRYAFILLTSVMTFTGLHAQKNETRTLAPFSKVRVADNVTMILVESSNTEVELVVKNIMNEKINTEVKGGEFKITTDGVINNGDIVGTLHYNGELTKLTPTYGGLIRNESPLVANSLEIDANLDGFTNLIVDVKDLLITGGQGSDIYVSGKAENVTVDATSGAKIHLEGLICTNAKVKASLGSKVWLTASQTYTAKVSMGSKVYYTKEPAGSFDKSYMTGGQILME